MTASSPPVPPPGAAQPGMRPEYLWEVLRTLWPPPARMARYGRLASPLARDRADAVEFLVFPNERNAVLLVPRRPRRVSAGALRSYKASAGRRDRLRFGTLALAARTGLAEVLPDRIGIIPDAGGPAADIGSYVRTALHADVLFSLYIGPARANRKPVLQALTPDGKVAGFVKVGIESLTCELVRAEAQALAFLASVTLPHLQTPRLLHHGCWQGHEVLVQQALPAGRPARSGADVSAAMAELAGVRGLRHLPAAQSPYWRDLQARLLAVAGRELASPLLQALDRLQPLAAGTTLAFGTWHGDWTPWNMTMLGDRALVWDWERFGTGVPVGFDAVHYSMQGAIIRGGIDAEAAADAVVTNAAQVLAPLGVDPAAGGLVASLYLIEIAARYLHDGQAEAGNRLGQIGTWLLPALGRHTQRLADGGRQ